MWFDALLSMPFWSMEGKQWGALGIEHRAYRGLASGFTRSAFGFYDCHKQGPKTPPKSRWCERHPVLHQHTNFTCDDGTGVMGWYCPSAKKKDEQRQAVIVDPWPGPTLFTEGWDAANFWDVCHISNFLGPKMIWKWWRPMKHPHTKKDSSHDITYAKMEHPKTTSLSPSLAQNNSEMTHL